MKTKQLIIAAIAGVALVSCADDEYIGNFSPDKTSIGIPNAINFTSTAKKTTRAEFFGAEAAEKLNNEFVFAGTKSTKGTDGTTPAATSYVFDQYVAKYVENTAGTTTSNSNNWEYVGFNSKAATSVPQSIKYWDYATTQYDFAAYSLGEAIDHDNNASTDPATATATAIAAGDKSYTLTGTADQLKHCYISDLVTYYNRDGVNDYQKTVQFKFRSLGTKIRVGFYETIPGYSVKNVKFYSDAATPLLAENTDNATTNAENKAANETPKLYASGAVLPAGSGTMTVTFPTTGWAYSPNGPDGTKNDPDYNQAHVEFALATGATAASKVEFGALANYPTTYEGVLNGGSFLGRASNSATYAGGLENGAGKYYTILPYSDGAVLTLKVDYTLQSIDGSGEEITVHGATALIPAQYTKWKPNFAYTYLFKISDNGNGKTDATQPKDGLYPITLDAVVIDAEDDDHTQETITTVAAPSITTYAKTSDVTNNNEYTTSDEIYVTAMKDGNLMKMTGKAVLYKIEKNLDADPELEAYEATEAEVLATLNTYSKLYAGEYSGRNGVKLTPVPSALDLTIESIPLVDGSNADVRKDLGNDTYETGYAALIDKTTLYAANYYAYVYDYTETPANITTQDEYATVTKAYNDDVTGLYRAHEEITAAGDAQADEKYYTRTGTGADEANKYVYTQQDVFLGQSVTGLYTRSGDGPYTYTAAEGKAVTGTTYYADDNGTAVDNIAYADFATLAASTDGLYTKGDGDVYTKIANDAAFEPNTIYYKKTGETSYKRCVVLPQQTTAGWFKTAGTVPFPCDDNETAKVGESYYDKYTVVSNADYAIKVIKIQ